MLLRGHLSGDTFGCHNLGMLLASCGEKLAVLLDTPGARNSPHPSKGCRDAHERVTLPARVSVAEK